MESGVPDAFSPGVEEIPQEEVIARQVEFFKAIAASDKDRLCTMLNQGMDPNVELPRPVPEEFVRRFEDPHLAYYVGREPGFTALMLASAMGNEVFVKILLMAGASPNKVTRRHKTFALWLAGKAGHIEIMRCLMGIGRDHEARLFRISIDLENQRATLYRRDQLVFETPISSGRKSHPTPTGRYLITNKYPMWKSTLYHAKMPHFLRLSCGDFGLHAGVLPGHPASHGCIRLPTEKAKELFAMVPVGTLVEIK